MATYTISPEEIDSKASVLFDFYSVTSRPEANLQRIQNYFCSNFSTLMNENFPSNWFSSMFPTFLNIVKLLCPPLEGKKKMQQAKVERKRRDGNEKDREKKIQTHNALKSLCAHIVVVLFLAHLKDTTANGQDDEAFYKEITALAIQKGLQSDDGNIIEILLAKFGQDSALKQMIIVLALIEPYIPYAKNQTCLIDAICLLGENPILYHTGGGQGSNRSIRDEIFRAIKGEPCQERNKPKKPPQERMNNRKRTIPVRFNQPKQPQKKQYLTASQQSILESSHDLISVDVIPTNIFIDLTEFEEPADEFITPRNSQYNNVEVIGK
jgi:hypothetical protein